jgi:hypothetical protein
MPFLQRHVPFWLAVLLDQPLVWIIPLVVILFPFFRLAPAIYDWVETRRVYKLYSELTCVEDDLLFNAPSRSQKDLIKRLDRLKDRAMRLSVPTPFKPLVYSLRFHIDMVRQEARKSIAP